MGLLFAIVAMERKAIQPVRGGGFELKEKAAGR
jgi:hypothetical protein